MCGGVFRGCGDVAGERGDGVEGVCGDALMVDRSLPASLVRGLRGLYGEEDCLSLLLREFAGDSVSFVP